MKKLACGIEYDGTDYRGFQRQPDTHGPTIQGELEAAIARISGERSVVYGAGRTDAGVHAMGQVVSFGVETGIPLDRMALALNSALPPDITVRSVEEVGPQATE